MTITTRGFAVLLLLVLPAACGGSGPASPTGIGQPPALAAPTPPAATNLPPLSGPSRTFTFAGELSHPVGAATKDSRFVLYENGAFVLQYVKLGLEYRGRYTEADGVVTFEWPGSNPSAPWGATGTIKTNSLTVRYSIGMQLSDFEDAVYVLMP